MILVLILGIIQTCAGACLMLRNLSGIIRVDAHVWVLDIHGKVLIYALATLCNLMALRRFSSTTAATLTWQLALAWFWSVQVLVVIVQFAGISSGRMLQGSHIFVTNLDKGRIWHVSSLVHQVAQFDCVLLLLIILNRLQLLSVWCDIVTSGPAGCAPFRCIFNLGSCKGLRYDLVFAMILNWYSGWSIGIVVAVGRCSVEHISCCFIVVNFSDLLHPLLLWHMMKTFAMRGSSNRLLLNTTLMREADYPTCCLPTGH